MKTHLLTIFLLSSISISVLSQTINLGEPAIFNDKIIQTNKYFQTPSIDNDIELKLEQERQENSKNKIHYFGKNNYVSINIFEKAEITILPNGDYLYQFGIQCKNAISINLLFDKFELASGVKMFLADPIKKKYDGAYTHLNNNNLKVLGTDIIYSDKVILEVEVPKEKVGLSSLSINSIIHGFRNLDQMAKSLNSSGNCEIDVNCPLGLGWENQRNSVAIVIVNGSGYCTGSLINNTSGSIIPYFLSANHCGTSPGAWVYRFRWESPEGQADCGTGAPSINGPENMNINGGSLRAANTDSDFTLIELNQAPNPSWGIYYSGWDRTNIPATQLTCIHHPAGDIKKISRDNSAAVSSSFNGGISDSHWQAPSWDEGVTEGGSSGSPLFNQNHRVIGQLHGGDSYCGAPASYQNDHFGKLQTSWTGGGTDDTRLSNWLDPGNIGSLYIDGVNPSIPNLAVDGGIGNGIINKSNACGDSLTPEISIYNSGIDTLFSATIQYGFDGLTDLIYNWNDTLATNHSTSILLPKILLGGGSHSMKAKFINNSGIDQNPLNDSIYKTFNTIVGGEILTLSLNINCYASENKWELLGENQTIIAHGGPYSNNSPVPIIESFCVMPYCYTFKLYDSGGDGIAAYGSSCLDGTFKLTDTNNVVVSELKAENANFGFTYESQFCANLAEKSVEEHITMYPNPANTSFTIYTQNLKIKEINITSITGQTIYTNTQINNATSIDVTTFSKGIYLVRIESEEGLYVKQMIVR